MIAKLYVTLLLLLLCIPIWAQHEITDTLKRTDKSLKLKPQVSLQQKDDYYNYGTGLPKFLEIPPENNEEEAQGYYSVDGYIKSNAADYEAWCNKVYGYYGRSNMLGSFKLSNFGMLIVKLENAGVSFSAPVSVREDNLQRSINIRMPQTGMKPVPVKPGGNWMLDMEQQQHNKKPYLPTDEEDENNMPGAENPFKYMELIAQYVAP